MFSTARKTIASVAALGALALGGSAIAGAADSSSSTQSAASTAQPQGRHVGPDGTREKALSSADAAKVKAAALAEYPGATVDRVETDVDHGSPYEAHITTSDGKQLEVLVDSDFKVTDAIEMHAPGQRP